MKGKEGEQKGRERKGSVGQERRGEEGEGKAGERKARWVPLETISSWCS